MPVDQILAGISKLSALVVGDICLDRWCTYDPATAEPSRETGIPRIGVVSSVVTPGAGGTVANNLIALGADRVSVLGVYGDDGFGMEVVRALEERNVSAEMMVRADGLSTFTYTKLINAETGVEDLPRVDFILTQPIPEVVERKILNRLDSAAAAHDVILVADQAETDLGGVVTAAVRELLFDIALRHSEKVIWVDSRKRADKFQGVIVKPNRDEAEAVSNRLFGRVDFKKLRKHIGGKLLFVTDGPRGVTVVDRYGETTVETRPVEKPVDICGAGDSFSAGAALALAVTDSPVEAARFGNLVASITIMKKGTGTASPQEVLAAAGEQP